MSTSQAKLDKKVCSSCQREFVKQEDFLDSTDQWRVCTAGNLWFNCVCGSTLMLPRGKFSWYSPELSMSEETKSVFNMFSERHSLPHIPSAVLELQQILMDPESEIQDLKNAVRKDPVIASEVIRTFESMRKIQSGSSRMSPALSSEGKTTVDLAHAISFIGEQQLSSIVMVAALRKHSLRTQAFLIQEHWDTAAKTALIAEHIWTTLFSKEGKDIAYLSGYLCNIGKLVLAMGFPDETDKIVNYLKDPKTQTTWSSAEKIIGTPDHRLLGEVGAAFWGFSDPVKECIRFHHTPPPYGPDMVYPKLVSVVGLSLMVTHWIDAEPHRFKESDLTYYEEDLGVDRAELERMIDQMLALNN